MLTITLITGSKMLQTPDFKKTTVIFLSCLIFATAVFSGCAAIFSDYLNKLGPEALIAEGKKLFKNKDYHNSEKAFKKFTEDFPNHKMMDVALMSLGDSIYYQTERYLEADFQYLNFIEIYPVHPMVDRAYFYKAMCSFKQIEVYNRDQTNTNDAIKNFETVITQYPKSKYYKKAKKYLKECQGLLAESTFHVGKYYYNVRAHQSTINRMRELIATYPNFKRNDEAQFLIAESYYNEENYPKAAVEYRLFLKKYRKSSFRTTAKNRLRKLKK